MLKTSLIYRNIFFYRFLMNILYKGKYQKRFEILFPLILGNKVTELCFGDIFIAKHCLQNKIEWTGIEVNEKFVSRAIAKGYAAQLNDIEQMVKFPTADTCIIMGSLYHFNENLSNLFPKLLDCAPIIIISEPILNLSNKGGLIGKLAKISATVNGQEQNFRFTRSQLIETLSNLTAKFKFQFKIIDEFEKDIIILITR